MVPEGNFDDLLQQVFDKFGQVAAKCIREEIDKLQFNSQSQKVDEIISVQDICKLLGVTRQTLHSWRKSGKLPFLRIGSRIFFEKSTVLSAMRRPQGLMKG